MQVWFATVFAASSAVFCSTFNFMKKKIHYKKKSYFFVTSYTLHSTTVFIKNKLCDTFFVVTKFLLFTKTIFGKEIFVRNYFFTHFFFFFWFFLAHKNLYPLLLFVLVQLSACTLNKFSVSHIGATISTCQDIQWLPYAGILCAWITSLRFYFSYGKAVYFSQRIIIFFN